MLAQLSGQIRVDPLPADAVVVGVHHFHEHPSDARPERPAQRRGLAKKAGETGEGRQRYEQPRPVQLRLPPDLEGISEQKKCPNAKPAIPRACQTRVPRIVVSVAPTICTGATCAEIRKPVAKRGSSIIGVEL